jgi:hypothetical protein
MSVGVGVGSRQRAQASGAGSRITKAITLRPEQGGTPYSGSGSEPSSSVSDISSSSLRSLGLNTISKT